MKKTVDLSARALTLRVEDSSENENEDADGVDMSGLDTDSTVHTDVVANGNEDEPNISIECEPRILNETTDRDREKEDDADLEIDEATDVQGEIAGTSNGQESVGSSELSCTCHGVQWQVTEGVVEDSRTHPRYSAKLLWEDDMFMTERKPIHYYRMSFPTQLLPDIITWSAKAMPSKKKIMDEVEFWNLLGIIYALTCTTNRRRDLWSTVDGIFPAPKFGSRFGISHGRFEKLLKYLRFCPPEEFSDANDKWAPVRRLIDAFNKRRAAKFFPSWSICVDESISAWRGKDGNYCSDGMPHVTKIARKPKGVGAELKDVACAVTQVIIALEIQEGKDAMATKKYMQEWKKTGTAQVLRLTEPWHGTGRVINADAAFASVTTAEACCMYGMHFTGLVKTATTKFPMDHFKHHEYKQQGDHHALTATINGHPYMACGWSDSTRKHFISTHNTTLEGNPHGKRRWREIDSDDISGTEVCIRYTK